MLTWLTNLFGGKTEATVEDLEDITVDVGSVEAEYAWIAEHRCACGGERKSATRSSSRDGMIYTDHHVVVCTDCGGKQDVAFRIDKSDDPMAKLLGSL